MWSCFDVGLAAQFGDDLPVDRDQAAGDEFLGLAARGDSGSGDDLLESFSRHG